MSSMMGADLIRGPVGMVIGLIVWLITFPLLLGAINGWYTQAVPAGVIGGERFDRVVVKGTNDVNEAWQGVTAVDSTGATGSATALVAATAYKLYENASDKCALSGVGTLTAAVIAYTPLGSEVSVATDGTVSGCEFKPAGSVFGAGGLSGLIEIILQAAGLAPPIALLFALGTFGTSFLRGMGNHPILAAVLTVIAFLLLATLLNVFIPFVGTAFEAIDGNRFVMYDEGLGNVATVIGNFFGVVIVASIMTVAWQVLQSLRGRNTLSGAGAYQM